ncbi:hypothetical protein Tco_0530898 [Tanacetum coccineum]
MLCSKALIIGEVMKNLSKKQPASSVEGPIIEETVDPLMVLMRYLVTMQTLGRGSLGGDDSSCSDSEDLDYDPKHDEVFDDDEHTHEDVPVSMNNLNFNPDTKHDLSIVVVEVHEHDLDVIDYD